MVNAYHKKTDPGRSIRNISNPKASRTGCPGERDHQTTKTHRTDQDGHPGGEGSAEKGGTMAKTDRDSRKANPGMSPGDQMDHGKSGVKALKKISAFFIFYGI
ncbi:hypothetical protein [Geobacillus phage TP-84]|uniref:Uncharacterized protein n=1 Tax=Geobacillus phage TP-84 TaxID=1965361 RepID=A0A2D1Q770_9CAUD|nr:hypothetical protein MUK65_gp43 [Geobacillus phage TP-84]ATP06112.1 hypothetical protein [Geobacillus phage TP-84]